MEALSNIDQVLVQRSGSTESSFVWTVAFFGEVTNVPLLVPSWNGDGCADCDALSSDYTIDPTNQILVAQTEAIGTWTSHGKLTAPDGNAADRFRQAVDLDGDQAIVGASTSSSLVTTS